MTEHRKDTALSVVQREELCAHGLSHHLYGVGLFIGVSIGNGNTDGVLTVSRAHCLTLLCNLYEGIVIVRLYEGAVLLFQRLFQLVLQHGTIESELALTAGNAGIDWRVHVGVCLHQRIADGLQCKSASHGAVSAGRIRIQRLDRRLLNHGCLNLEGARWTYCNALPAGQTA